MRYFEVKTEGIPPSIYYYSDYPGVGIYAPKGESMYVIIYDNCGMQTGLTVPKKSFEEIEFEKPTGPVQTEQVIKANDIATILAVALHKDAAERFVTK